MLLIRWILTGVLGGILSLIAHAIIVMRNWSVAGSIRRHFARSSTLVQAVYRREFVREFQRCLSGPRGHSLLHDFAPVPNRPHQTPVGVRLAILPYRRVPKIHASPLCASPSTIASRLVGTTRDLRERRSAISRTSPLSTPRKKPPGPSNCGSWAREGRVQFSQSSPPPLSPGGGRGGRGG